MKTTTKNDQTTKFIRFGEWEWYRNRKVTKCFGSNQKMLHVLKIPLQCAISYNYMDFKQKSHNELSDTEKFTHVSLLNILDRCDIPHEILSAAIHKLETDGIIMLAVLPFKAKVYIQKRFIKWGKPASRKPYKPLKLQAKPSYIKGQNSNTFEIALIRFVETILLHHPNLELKSWTRMPYVSSGDTHFTHYTIDMAFMVFSLS